MLGPGDRGSYREASGEKGKPAISKDVAQLSLTWFLDQQVQDRNIQQV